MTNYQAKVCRIILRKKTVGRILRKTNIADEVSLQEVFDPFMIDLSGDDDPMNDVVTLEPELLEQCEKRSRALIRDNVALAMSGSALIVSVVSLCCS